MVFMDNCGLNLANQLGLLICLHKNNKWYFLRGLFNWLLLFAIFIHAGWYCLQHYSSSTHLEESTYALVSTCNVSMHLMKTLVMMLKNDRFLVLYLKLKRYYDDPRKYRSKIRKEIDGQAAFYNGLYVKFVVGACITVIITPMIVQSMEYYRTGSIIDSRWDLPVNYENPFFSLEESPAYEIYYVIFGLTFIPRVLFAFSIDLLYMATCLHIYGLFRELQQRIRMMCWTANGRRASRREFCANFRNCVDFQNEIYEIVKETQEVFSIIFFLQFVGTMIVICFQLFLGVRVSGSANC